MKRLIVLLLLLSSGTFTATATDVSITIQEAKEKHQARLMALPGVISLGIGLSEGETVIIVGLDGKHPNTEKALPTKLEGYRIVTQNVGTIKAR